MTLDELRVSIMADLERLREMGGAAARPLTHTRQRPGSKRVITGQERVTAEDAEQKQRDKSLDAMATYRGAIRHTRR